MRNVFQHTSLHSAAENANVAAADAILSHARTMLAPRVSDDSFMMLELLGAQDEVRFLPTMFVNIPLVICTL
jgi:hypothetical protein